MTFTFDAQVPERGFSVQLALEPGETLAVLGPNGAGKSTFLGLIAGLIRPATGHAELDGTVLFDFGPARSRRWVAPHNRGVSMLAQEPLLFPHLSVRDNVAFGPRSAGMPRAAANSAARDWLVEVDALELADRRPVSLSGGQAQRVAVARALASDPHLLLLDEPLAALDITVAPVLRRMLKRVLDNRSAVIVTHDILDALVLADRVMILENGRVVDEGPTREVFTRPRTAFAAELAGLNLLRGKKTAAGLLTAHGVEVRAAAGSAIAAETAVGGAFRPADVRISRERPHDSSENCLFLAVSDLESRGDSVRVHTNILTADVDPFVSAELDLAAHESFWFCFRPDAVKVYPLR